jgi:HlyD family secretion protein
MKGRVKLAIVAVAAVAVVGTLSFALFGGSDEEYEYFTAEVIRQTIQNTVSATGTVEAVVTVQVGSQVSGQIQTLYADFNSIVRSGQLLAKLDPRNFEAQLENARASLVSARARVRTAEADLANGRASLESSRASLEAARVESERAVLLYRRSQELAETDLISQSDLEAAQATSDAANARLAQAQAAIEQAEAQIVSREAGLEQAVAQVVQAEADVNRAEINLEYTDITSPVDGVVISREVDVGQTVAASMSAPTLFMIANDLSQMRVNASIDEADIGKLAQSNQVEFTVDAFPNERFRGAIEEIRLNPQTVQNVVTYNVIVGVSNRDLKLKPGMTANITVTVDRRENALGLPNAALRYNPPDLDPSAFEQAFERGGELRGPNGDFDAGVGAAPPRTGSDFLDGGSGGLSAREGIVPGNGGAGGRRDRDTADLPVAVGERDAGSARRGAFVATDIEAAAAAPGQLWDVGEKIRFQEVAPTPPRRGRVWVLNPEGVPEPRALLLGITDGSRTEIVDGELAEGDSVIIGDSSQGADTDDGTQIRGGFRGFPGGGFAGRGFR